MALKKKHHPIVERIGSRVRELRTGLGLSQQDLGFRSHLSANFIGRVERGEVALGTDALAEIAEALGVDPARLVEGSTPKTQPLEQVKQHLSQKLKSLLARDDLPALQAMGIIVGLLDNALARQNR